MSGTHTSPEGDDGFTLDFADAPSPLDVLRVTFEHARMAACVTDPAEPDNPIVYVNAAFEALTGYDADEVTARNCRFLQGGDSDEAARAELRAAIRKQRTCVVELDNYRKDGTPFRNALHIAPIRDERGQLRYYLGSQWDVSEVFRARSCSVRSADTELNAHISRLLTALGSIAADAARGPVSSDATERARERIVALGRIHQNAEDPSPGASLAKMDSLVDTILGPFARCTHRRLDTECADLVLQTSAIVPLSFVLCELAASSRRHGALADPAPAPCTDHPSLRIARDGERVRLRWHEPLAQPKPEGADGTEHDIVANLVRSLGGSMRFGVDGRHRHAEITFPFEAVCLASARAAHEDATRQEPAR